MSLKFIIVFFAVSVSCIDSSLFLFILRAEKLGRPQSDCLAPELSANEGLAAPATSHLLPPVLAGFVLSFLPHLAAAASNEEVKHKLKRSAPTERGKVDDNHGEYRPLHQARARRSVGRYFTQEWRDAFWIQQITT